jgi:repressor LexA
MQSARSNAMSKQKTESITEPQARTLRAICLILDSTGLPPTVKELAEALGISHASAHEQIAQLVRKGYLRKEEKKARSIVVVNRNE